MTYFTLENTDGFTKEQLREFNDNFPRFALDNNFDLEDADEYKNAIDSYHNQVMIYVAK